MNLPENILYSKDHEWLREENGTATVGISSYALEQLGDIVHIELPEEGENFAAGDPFGTVESTKTVSDLYLPAKGKVLEINKKLLESPESLQADPYNTGWLIKIKLEEKQSELMTASSYQTYLSQGA